MSNKPVPERYNLVYFLLLVSAIIYYWLAYQTTRNNFTYFIGLFTILFAIYFFACRFFSVTKFRQLLLAGLLFRVLLLFSVPQLSDDVYRFIWDGRLSANGINPFRYLPSEIMSMPPVKGITSELYARLNSPSYHTVYPPVLQGIFLLAGKLFPLNIWSAIVFFKTIIIVVEVGTVLMMIQLLKKMLLPIHASLLYWLNPLVIMELTGNSHFDGLMICFVLLALLLLVNKIWQVSSICLGIGIATKLVPVLFIPLIIRKLGWKKGALYLLITIITTVVLFSLVLDIATIQHLLESINLFFTRFEFNASIYYLVRWAGELVKGYNIIALAGPALSMIAGSVILLLSFHKKPAVHLSFFTKCLFIITIWYLFSTTVHPWYVCLPLALSIVTGYRFTLIWSFTALMSYAAYQWNPVQENLWLTAAGYIFMIGFAGWEIKQRQICPTISK